MGSIYFEKYPILLSSINKDPSKYWYVEKYINGVLTETIETALGQKVVFGKAVSAINPTDAFYNWAIAANSTKSTFNGTSSYSNTTTAVKNNLDNKNTIKIYAIFSYKETSLQSVTKNLTHTMVVDEQITYWFTQTTITNGVRGSSSRIYAEDCSAIITVDGKQVTNTPDSNKNYHMTLHTGQKVIIQHDNARVNGSSGVGFNNYLSCTDNVTTTKYRQ